MIVIIINNDTNSNLLMLWFRHYITLNIKFSIVIENIEQKYNYIDNKFIIKREEINKDDILITENDFIFSYKKEDECMGLSKNIKNDEINKPQIIGRVFLVPVKDKPYYTTFEKLKGGEYKPLFSGINKGNNKSNRVFIPKIKIKFFQHNTVFKISCKLYF
jgi:hypothetical protein